MNSSRSFTRSGPGRMHQQCDPGGKPKRRLTIAAYGGNWQGTPYISYREYDRATRLMRRRRGMTRAEATAAVIAERP